MNLSGGKDYQWELSQEGKEWVNARVDNQAYTPRGDSEHEHKRAYCDLRNWRMSLANVYHSLWPNLDLSPYGKWKTARKVRSRYFWNQKLYAHSLRTESG